MRGQQKRMTPPVWVLAAGVALEVVAGAIAFLTTAALVALVLCMVGLACLGGAGDVMRLSSGRRAADRS